MRKITKSMFDDNQKRQDQAQLKKDKEYQKQQAIEELERATLHEIKRKENIIKLSLLKDELNLTEKIFNLGSKSFNSSGFATIYDVYAEDYFVNFDCIGEDIKNLEKDVYILTLLWFFKEYPEDLALLVDELNPTAELSIRRQEYGYGGYSSSLSIEYYHPEMDKRNYTLFGKYGLIGRFLRSSIDVTE